MRARMLALRRADRRAVAGAVAQRAAAAGRDAGAGASRRRRRPRRRPTAAPRRRRAPETYTYRADGRRDPFLNLLGTGSETQADVAHAARARRA